MPDTPLTHAESIKVATAKMEHALNTMMDQLWPIVKPAVTAKVKEESSSFASWFVSESRAINEIMKEVHQDAPGWGGGGDNPRNPHDVTHDMKDFAQFYMNYMFDKDTYEKYVKPALKDNEDVAKAIFEHMKHSEFAAGFTTVDKLPDELLAAYNKYSNKIPDTADVFRFYEVMAGQKDLLQITNADLQDAGIHKQLAANYIPVPTSENHRVDSADYGNLVPSLSARVADSKDVVQRV